MVRFQLMFALQVPLMLLLVAAPSVPSTVGAQEVVCGDGVTEADEECDDGGICIGGANAGTPCTAESECEGNGVCVGGLKHGAACPDDTACPGGRCVRCRPFGGDGCAGNCTLETDVPVHFVSGELRDGRLPPGTSGATIRGVGVELAFSISGEQTMTIGKPRADGVMPVVNRADSLRLSRTSIAAAACVCVRGLPAKTCGGVVTEADGSRATDCTPEYTAGDSLCEGRNPCAFTHGPGNAGSGLIGCDGLEGTDLSVTQDGTRTNGPLSPPVLALGGMGGPGSALLFTSTAIGVNIGPCSGSLPAQYGPDGEFCTDDDPQRVRGMVNTVPSVSGTATGTTLNVNGDDGVVLGPFSGIGVPFSCSALAEGTVRDAIVAGAFAIPGQPLLGDLVVTTMIVIRSGPPDTPTPTPTRTPTRTPRPSATPTPAVTSTPTSTPTETLPSTPTPVACAGDCDGDRRVGIDELIRGINVALALAPAGDCHAIDLNGDGTVTIDELIAAVQAALNGCA